MPDSQPDTTIINTRLRAAAEARKHHAMLKETHDTLLQAFQEEHAGLIKALDMAKTTVKEEEALAREAITRHFDTHGDKKPLPGAGIRVMVDTIYDYHVASKNQLIAVLAEANKVRFEKGREAMYEFLDNKASDYGIVLDAKTYEALLKQNPDTMYGQLSERPTATLAKDLSEYLEDDHDTQ